MRDAITGRPSEREWGGTTREPLAFAWSSVRALPTWRHRTGTAIPLRDRGPAAGSPLF
ncbi:hypothetical protein ACFR9U_20130 [Halorientalis brevis]|uniref:Uncharacterized protein n=1 Tax=Halorientalis brevis TaxID=1126241 RepID=A0ABD6CG56_9EURY|nr:hypothetical protein [Halorientalis brevis]